MSYPPLISSTECPRCGSHSFTISAEENAIICNSCGHMISSPQEAQLFGDFSYEGSGSASSVGHVNIETGSVIEDTFFRRRIFGGINWQEKYQKELEELRKEISELKKNFELISPKIVIVEEIPKEEARDLIINYFKENDSADIEELLEVLKIPVSMIIDILDELKNEGIISAKEE